MSEAEKTESKGSVWYGTRSDPILALQPVLWFSDPAGNKGVLETEGWGGGGAPESCVTAALRAAGFVGGGARASALRLHDDERQCVRHHGFDVPEDRWPLIESGMRELLGGALGGWTEVLAGQAGFHAPSHMTHIFAVLWATAGRPPVQVAHHLPPPPPKTSGAPIDLAGFPLADRRLLMLLERFGGTQKRPSDFLTDQKTHMEIQQYLKVAPEECEFCGGRLYESGGYYWCANAATMDSKPDLEHE